MLSNSEKKIAIEDFDLNDLHKMINIFLMEYFLILMKSFDNSNFSMIFFGLEEDKFSNIFLLLKLFHNFIF